MADSRGVSSALLRPIRVLPRPKTQFLLRNPQTRSDLTSAPIGANIRSTREVVSRSSPFYVRQLNYGLNLRDLLFFGFAFFNSFLDLFTSPPFRRMVEPRLDGSHRLNRNSNSPRSFSGFHAAPKGDLITLGSLPRARSAKNAEPHPGRSATVDPAFPLNGIAIPAHVLMDRAVDCQGLRFPGKDHKDGDRHRRRFGLQGCSTKGASHRVLNSQGQRRFYET
jgi:hypothetical protein